MLAAMVALPSCQDSYENVADNNMLFSTSQDRVVTTLLDGKAGEITKPVSYRLAQLVEGDIEIEVGVMPDAVEAYNLSYDENAVLLPSENYSIASGTAVIYNGGVESTPVDVTFTGLLDIDPDQVYVLPVGVKSSPVPVVESKNITFYVFRGAALVNWAAGLKGTCMTFVNEGQTPGLGSISDFSFETLINPSAFNNTLSTIMGIEGKFLIRVGDAGLPSNQIQLATGSGNATDAAWQLDLNKWTHVCLTYESATGSVNVYFNGVKKGNTQTVGYRQAVNWNVASGDRACYIGYAYDRNRDLDGYLCETRVWNKILEPADLNERNHFYRVDNDAPGLVLYLKMDEGTGNLVKDYCNGYDMNVPEFWPDGNYSSPVGQGLTWLPVTLP